MYATLGLSVVLATLCAASPYYQPQQRQLFYSAVPSVVPQYQQYTPYPAYQPYAQYPQYTPVAPAPAAFKQYYYPQTAANLVAPVPSALRYPAAVAPAKQVVYYPGAAPYPLVAGDEASEENSWSSIFNGFNHYFTNPFSGSAPATGEAGAAPAPAETPAPAEKDGEKEKEDEKKSEEDKPEEENKVKAAPQKYVLVGQPQFYGLQPVNPAAVIPSPQNGAVSSYLLLKNYPGVRFASPFPQVPQVQQFPQVQQQVPQVQQIPQQPADAELIPAGKAALSYYKLLQQAQTQASRQQKEYEDTAAVTVDADTKDAAQDDDKESANQEETATDKEDDDEPGPTIAQAKPKAVALAGPGGVAAAAPVGTALVGPGGMAISAPEATAVAGAKGAGASGAVSPATAKMASKAVRTYQLATQNLGYLLNL